MHNWSRTVWKDVARTEPFPLQWIHLWPIESFHPTYGIRSTLVRLLLSVYLASWRIGGHENSSPTEQHNEAVTYMWNVSAVIATVITVRQFADHCLCNTSTNAASCVHTFSASLSLSPSFPVSLALSSRLYHGHLRLKRVKKTNDAPKDAITTVDYAAALSFRS